MVKNKNSTIQLVFILSGAIVAFHIGAGFSSGQEVLQFFTGFGFWKSIVSLLIAFCIFSISTFLILNKIRKLEKKDISTCYSCISTKYMSRFLMFCVPVLLYLIYIVMIAGAGAVAQEHFGVSTLWGRIFMTVIILLTVLNGLNKLVNIIGSIGHIVVVMVLLLGGITLVSSWQNIFNDNTVLLDNIPKVSSSFIISALLYGGFGVLTGVVFLSGISNRIKTKKQCVLVSVLGNGVFIIAALFLSTSLLLNIDIVLGYQIPTLQLAQNISPFFAKLFTVVLFMGGYTTATPMLWSIVSALEKDEKSLWYKVFCVTLAVIALLLSAYPFDVLLNIIYPVIGSVGICFILDMLCKNGIYKVKNLSKH